MTPKRKLFVWFLFLIAAGVTNCVGQQSIPDLSEVSPEQLGSVKVHRASKHLRAEGDAPSSFTVITADEMREPVPGQASPVHRRKPVDTSVLTVGESKALLRKGES
jgi:hypothetical protein